MNAQGAEASNSRPKARPADACEQKKLAVPLARALIRKSLKGALATFDAGVNAPESATENWPYASLVTTATTPAGAPLLLISKLARHTRNLTQNPSASILFDGTGNAGDPLAQGRVTLLGRFAPAKNNDTAAQRFLARHRESEMYAGFPDFSFYEMEVLSAHFIGGFGLIVDLLRDDLLIDTQQADALVDDEPGIVAHMNEDHADTLALYAEKLADEQPGNGTWHMTGIDTLGFDIVRASTCVRIDFDEPVLSPQQARAAFKALADKARAKT